MKRGSSLVRKIIILAWFSRPPIRGKPWTILFLLLPILFLALLFFLSLPRPLFDVSYSPVLYDRNGSLLGAKVASDGQWRFPSPEKLNDRYVAALIEAEDKRFRWHPGIDPFAVARALEQNIRGKRVVSGASTLTMQTIRLSRGRRKRSMFEKVIEAYLAVRLEATHSKKKILTLYATNAPFGANVIGIEAAAWRWFGRSSEDLSWAEAATLAILPNSPSLIHPGRNRDALRNKRDSLLKKLNEKGHIDDGTYLLSVAEPIPGEPLPLPRLAPHLLDRIIREEGGVSAIKNNAAFTTTIDRDLQERVASIMGRATARFEPNGIMNGACVVLNTETGEVAAYIGNSGTLHSGDVDIVLSRRSSGSLLKPFLYAAMLDSGDILPSSLVSDIPTRVGSFAPENITRTYLGVVPADEALARSLNVPAARSLRVYGVDRFARLLRSLGLSTLFRPGNEYGLPLILGGAEVTLWEITGLYAGLARVVDAKENGEAAAFFSPSVFHRESRGTGARAGGDSGRQVISPAAAWITLETLVSVSRPGEESIWQEYADSRRIAWKTGTSYGFRDAWAIGVSPEWTVGVWIGNATGEGRAELRSAVTSAPVLFEIFSALDSIGGNRGTWFHQPAARLRHVEACAYSGFPAGVNCTAIKTTEVPRDAPAMRVCPYCRTILLNETQDRRITLEGGSTAITVERKWFILPPAEEWYYRRWNLDYRPPPPEDRPAGGTARDGNTLALFNPEPDSQVYIPRELDGSEGKIVFSAAHREETEVIYWHLDGDYLGETNSFHEMEARPVAGIHVLTLVDSRGNTLTRRFTVLSQEN
jgi:penicillin-binding protein 1C